MFSKGDSFADRLEFSGLPHSEAVAIAAPESPDSKPDAGFSVSDDAFPEGYWGICRDYLNCTNPQTGLEVVFVPGERLPDWAAAAQRERFDADTSNPAPRVEAPSVSRRAVRSTLKDSKGGKP